MEENASDMNDHPSDDAQASPDVTAPASVSPSASGDTQHENDSTPHSQDPPSPDVIILDSSDDDSDCYANPAPPKELLDNQLIDADTIGDTVFSKRWLFTTLMKLIQEVDKEENSKQEAAEGCDDCLDLEESLQDELCKLWDMSMNPTVVSFLMEFESIDLLTGVIAKSKAPRAVEICVGILANMACIPAACRAISNSEKLRSLLLLLLSSPDAPTLVETSRLVYTCVATPAVCDLWLSSIRETEPLYTSLVFMLRSSTNKELLGHVADLIDKLMDSEDSILIEWSTTELVEAILEGVKQAGNKDTLETFLHILQLVSTCELGVEALGQQADPLYRLVVEYLDRLCSEDMVILQGEENNVGSALSVLAVAFTALDDKTGILGKDYHLIRCLLKLLEVVYPQIRSITPALKPQRSRSDSCGSVEGKPRSRTLSCTVEGAGDTQKKSEKQAQGSTESGKPSQDGDSSQCSSTHPGSTNSAQCSSTHPGSTNVQKVDSEDSGVLEMLYELLQNIVTDIVLVISEEDGDEQQQPQSDDPEKPSTPNPVPTPNKPKSQTLVYLNDLCPRQRLRVAVHTLDEVRVDTELDCCGRLQQVALNHGLSRLEGIVQQYSAG